MALSDGPSRSRRRWTSFISPFLVGLTLCRLCGGQVVENVSEDTDRRFLLLISEMNGKLTALNVKSGNIVWDFDTKEPLISSTITKLELNESGVLTRLIPGLDGRLYQFDGEMIEPLPLSADNLLDSSVRFHENSFIVGGKELSSFGINPENGEVHYACTSRGCDTQNKNHVMSGGDNLLVLSTNARTIRAIDMKSGQEKWNFSVGQHELSYISSSPVSPGDQDQGVDGGEQDFSHTAGHIPPADSSDAPNWDYLSWFRSDSYDMSDMIDIKVIVPKGIVKAVYKNDPSNTLWTHQFGAPIAGAWTLNKHVLEKMSLFDDRHVPALASAADMEDGDVADVSRRARGEALLYLGMHNNQLYVQPSVRLLRRTQAPPIDALALTLPKVQWRPYLATAPSRTPLMTSQQLGWEKQQDSSSTQLISWHDQYPFDSGYYLLDDQSSLPRTAITYLDNTNSLARYWWQTAAVAVACTIIVSLAVHLAIARYVGGADRRALLRMMSFSSETDAPLSLITTSGSGVQISPTPSPTLSDVVPFSSRYCSDFEQLERLGHGGYGVVFTARNRLDDCVYAVKRIPLKNSEQAREKAMREVKALAKLDHASIVRYYQAWFESPPTGWQEERDRLDELSSLPPPVGASDFLSRDNDDLLSAAYMSQQQTGAQDGDTPSRFVGIVNRGCISSGELGSRFDYNDDASLLDSDLQRGDANRVADDNNFTAENRTENDWVTFEASAAKWDARAKALADDNTASMDIVFDNTRCTCKPKISGGPSTVSDVTADCDIVFEEESKCAECTRFSMISEKSCSKANRPSSAGDSHRHGNRKPPSPIGSVISRHSDDKKSKRQRLPRMYLYIQMQLCQRESLRDWLQRHTSDRDRSQSLSIFEQIVVAVDYVHSHGLMHRDLKPSNIFFAMDGHVKVGDFGLATASEEQPADTDGLDTDTATGGQGQHTNQVGTRLYMSPEQEAGRGYTHKVDIYSLGLIFVEIFSPCVTQMERTVTLQNAKQLLFPKPFHAMTDEYEFVLPLLSRDPDTRPSTSDILRHKLLGDFEVAREAYTRLHSKVVPSLSESSQSF